MKIPLFDLDGTVVKSGSTIHSAAFEYAAKRIFGITLSTTLAEMQGKVDTQVLIELLQPHGISEKEAKAKMSEAMHTMDEYFNQHIKEELPIILPGVKSLLETLKEKKVPMGLLTGNVEGIGWGKMKQLGIRHFFTFGAFGSMAYKREDLVPIAYKNLIHATHGNYQLTDLVIVGDTPRDIACAHANGIQAFCVATGAYSEEELRKADADVVVPTLEDKEKLINFLLN